LSSEEQYSKYVKFSDIQIRLEETTRQDDSQVDRFYIGIKKSHCRYEEQKLVLATSLKTSITKVSTYRKEEVKVDQAKPESTFSLKSTSTEAAARDNVELPYFIGEGLIEVDQEDRDDIMREELAIQEEDEEY